MPRGALGVARQADPGPLIVRRWVRQHRLTPVCCSWHRSHEQRSRQGAIDLHRLRTLLPGRCVRLRLPVFPAILYRASPVAVAASKLLCPAFAFGFVADVLLAFVPERAPKSVVITQVCAPL